MKTENSIEILIKNSKLREKQYNVNIAIARGIITSILPANSDLNNKIEEAAAITIDAKGSLATPAFIDPHLHIDRSMTNYSPAESRQRSSNHVAGLPDEDSDDLSDNPDAVYKRTCNIIKTALQNGVTAIRAHVDIVQQSALTALKAVAAAKKDFRDIIHIQICPFPREGVFRNRALMRLFKKAARKEADVIGGNPGSEMTWEDARNHIDLCFKLAKYHKKPLDIHIDETGGQMIREIEYISSKKIKDAYTGSVTISHAGSLYSETAETHAKTISLIKESGISLITTPATDLMNHGFCNMMLKQIRSAGIKIAYAQGVACSSSYPGWGDIDPLKTGTLLAHSSRLNTYDEIEFLYDMPTYNSADILGIEDWRIAEGAPANIVIVDAANISEAFRNISAKLFVISSGKLAATTEHLSRTCFNIE